MADREITVNGIKITMTPAEVSFHSALTGDFSAFCIPVEFSDAAIEFYDLYFEREKPTVIIACRKGYDIAVILDEKTGTMESWHYTK